MLFMQILRKVLRPRHNMLEKDYQPGLLLCLPARVAFIIAFCMAMKRDLIHIQHTLHAGFVSASEDAAAPKCQWAAYHYSCQNNRAIPSGVALLF